MKITPIPTGTKDILPSEAVEIRALEEAIRNVFDSYGYAEVMTPTLELEAVLETAGERRYRKSFRLFDERGDVLVMRPDMTTPIARLASTRMAGAELPFRLCYFANSFRPTRPQRGRQSEFFQAGLELIGADSPAVDAEVLAACCQALIACGLKDFSIVLGESSYFKALLEDIGISGQEREDVFAALGRRDMVELDEVVRALDVPAEDRQAIIDVIYLRGGTEVLATAKDQLRGKGMEAALRRLARTYYLASRYGFADRIRFDLGITRNFDYYTGIVFEVLSGELGFPLGGGGRYDGLLAKFGRPAPAVGFALGLDRLHIAITEQGGVQFPRAAGVALVGGLDPQLDLARDLRERGIRVLALAEDTGMDKACRLAAEAGISYMVMPAGDQFLLEKLESGASETMTGEELVERLAE